MNKAVSARKSKKGKSAPAPVAVIDQDAELAALLADTSLDDEVPETVAAEAEVSDLEDAIEAIEIEDEVKSAMKAAETDPEPLPLESEEAPVIAVSTGKPAGKKERAPRVSGPPSAQLTVKLGAKLLDALTLDVDMAGLNDAGREDAVKAVLTGIDKMPKKVAEKAQNLVLALNAGVSLSCYTKIAVNMLVEQGTMTTDDLRKRYLKRPYTVGTANAQSSQMFTLLPALKIATREGNKLVLNENSLLVGFFKEEKKAAA